MFSQLANPHFRSGPYPRLPTNKKTQASHFWCHGGWCTTHEGIGVPQVPRWAVFSAAGTSDGAMVVECCRCSCCSCCCPGGTKQWMMRASTQKGGCKKWNIANDQSYCPVHLEWWCYHVGWCRVLTSRIWLSQSPVVRRCCRKYEQKQTEYDLSDYRLDIHNYLHGGWDVLSVIAIPRW